MSKIPVNLNRVPYGGHYTLMVPEKGFVGIGATFEKLESSVRTWRRANGIPLGLGFHEELIEVVCQQYPQECKEGNPLLQPPKKLRLGDVMLGTQVFLHAALEKIRGRSPVVSLAEATRRAAICVDCKYNVTFSKPCGGGCGKLKQFVTSMVGRQKVPQYEKLGACHWCKCFLEAAVWIDLRIQLKPLSAELKQKFEEVPACWKKESLL